MLVVFSFEKYYEQEESRSRHDGVQIVCHALFQDMILMGACLSERASRVVSDVPGVTATGRELHKAMVPCHSEHRAFLVYRKKQQKPG